MTMFPHRLNITVFDNKSGQGLSRIALKLTLFARRKGNYTIPMVTNSAGEVYLSAEHVRQSIEDDWELFPMDYESTLEECSQDVEIKICTPEDVRRTVQAMRMFRSASSISDELIERFENAANEQYIPVTARFNVEENNNITIGIDSRLQSNNNPEKLAR